MTGISVACLALAVLGADPDAPRASDDSTTAPPADVVQQAVTFLHADDPDQRANASRSLQSHDARLLRLAFRAALAQAPPFARRAQPGTTTHTFAARWWDGQIVVAVRVPPQFDPARAYPVLIGVPWTNGTADQALAYWHRALGSHADAFLLACPSQNESGGYHAHDAERRLPLAVLDWLTRRFRIDANRVFLAGYSKGGHAAWDTGLLHGDRFAGMIPLAGSGSHELGTYVAMDYLDNTPHVPLFAVWGAEDKGIAQKCRRKVEHLRTAGHHPVGIELPGVGHGKVRVPAEALVAWCQSQRRDPHPTRLRKWFHRCVQGHCFWVEVTALAGPEYNPGGKVRIRVRRPVSKERLRGLVRRKLLDQLVRLRASVIGNTFALRTRRVTRVDLWIDPEVVNLGVDP